MPIRRVSLLLPFLLHVAACDRGRAADAADHPGGAARPSGASTPHSAEAIGARKEFRVATYNAGLAVGLLKYAEERAAPLVRALAEQPVDLLCVQELWQGRHWRELAESTAATLPNQYRLPDAGTGGTCDESEVAPLSACAGSKCASLDEHEVPLCLLANCRGELTRLSADCFNCLAANPRERPEALAAACVSGGASAGALSSDARGLKARGARGAARQARGPGLSLAEIRVYGGSYGTGILTNAQILERDARVLPSVFDSRAVLYTKLSTPVGEVNAFCTHLTANLGGVPHPGGASWERDQSAQIDALLAFIDEKAAGRPALLLGDLNTGPAIEPSIAAALPEHYDRFVGRGFFDPYAAAKDAACTYCFDNPLSGGAGTRGTLIDHVMVRDLSGVARPGGRIMRSEVEIRRAGDAVRIGPSDHYGVMVTLSPSGG